MGEDTVSPCIDSEGVHGHSGTIFVEAPVLGGPPYWGSGAHTSPRSRGPIQQAYVILRQRCPNQDGNPYQFRTKTRQDTLTNWHRRPVPSFVRSRDWTALVTVDRKWA